MNNFLHSPGRITICILSGEYKKFFTRANIYSYSPGRIPIQIPIRSPIRIPNLRYPLGLRLTTPPYPFESSLSLLSFRVFLLPPLSSGVFLLPPPPLTSWVIPHQHYILSCSTVCYRVPTVSHYILLCAIVSHYILSCSTVSHVLFLFFMHVLFL